MSYPYGGGDSDTSESSTFTTGVQPISTANPRQPIPANRLTPEQTDRILGQLTVTWESLPQLPFWAPLGGQTETWRRQSVAAAVNGLAVLLQRPLTATEANAVAEHSCKARVKESYEVPVLLGSAAFFTYRGREKWRFPFWTPKPTSTWFTPHSFPTISYAILRGAPAMRLWTGVRFLAYMAVLRFLTQPLFTGYANAGFAINVMTDKRLKAVTEMREREMQAQKAARSGLPSASTVPSTEEQQEQQQQQSTWPRPAQSQRGQPQQPLPSWRKPQPAKEETSSSAFDDNSGLFDDDDNDASPIAPSHRRPAPTPAPSTTAPGSAWSKLREQAKSGGTGATASSAPTASSAESYTYAESEREKNYARDQAQKEFDALLERERRSS